MRMKSKFVSINCTKIEQKQKVPKSIFAYKSKILDAERPSWQTKIFFNHYIGDLRNVGPVFPFIPLAFQKIEYTFTSLYIRYQINDQVRIRIGHFFLSTN